MRIVLPLLLLFQLGLLPDAAAQPNLPEAYRLDTVPCFLDDCADMDADNSVQFFRLQVPANWEESDGPVFDLGVLMLRALRPTPAPNPVLMLPGGPGGSFIANADALRAYPLRATSDLVFLDFRGTGSSQPTLCPDLNEELWRLYGADLGPEALIQSIQEAASACYQDMERAGHSPAAFSSRQTARDIEALRRALGVSQWNLLGLSYGTFVAQLTQRTFPESVRAMVLDSPVPINYNRLGDLEAHYHRALELLFSTCSQDPDCSDRFPQLEEKYYQAMNGLRLRPLSVDKPRALPGSGAFVLNFSEAHAGVFNLMYRPEGYAVLPLLIDVLLDRDEDVLERLIATEYGRLQGASMGNQLAVRLQDEDRWMRAWSGEADDPRYPRLEGALAISRAIDLAVRDQVRSLPDSVVQMAPDPTVPTLILSGRFDPITPPAYGQRLTSLYPNSVFVNFPGEAHGVLHPGNACGQVILRAFIERPGERSSLECLDGATESIPYITRLYRNSKLSGLVERLRRGAWTTYGWVGLSLLLLLSGPIWWLVTHLVRKLRSAEPHPVAATAARSSMVGTAVVAMLLLVLLGRYLLQTADANPYLLLFGLLPQARWLPVLSWLVGLGALAGLAGVAGAWWSGWWKKGARVHFTLVTAGAVMLVIFLLRYQLF